MGEALRKERRKGFHKRLDAENIELRKQMMEMQSVVTRLLVAMLRFAMGSNWTRRVLEKGYCWPWNKPQERAPEYIWVGAGNPEKAAHDIMEECFGKGYRGQAERMLKASIANREREMKEEADANKSADRPLEGSFGPHYTGRRE